MSQIVYYIMHKDRVVAQASTTGQCKIFDEKFMPYSLWLDDTSEDIETLVNNVINFNFWCASRMLTLDRTYAKELLNSIGVKQAVTDKERALIALSYRCASITDVYWVKNEDENVCFAQVNLYDNHLSNAFIDISLQGKQYSVNNENLARDIATNGLFPKAWRRTENGFELLKDGGREAVFRELLASRICQCFDLRQVKYELSEFDGEPVTVSENFTSKEYSIVAMDAYEIYAANHNRNVKEDVLLLDKYNYYMMNIVDYLVGNTDRHWGNWGMLVDNENNEVVSLHPLMDFNQTFQAYNTLDGANCQTLFGERATQKEAAIAAVEAIGLNQIAKVRKLWFDGMPEVYEMFVQRLECLKERL